MRVFKFKDCNVGAAQTGQGFGENWAMYLYKECIDLVLAIFLASSTLLL